MTNFDFLKDDPQFSGFADAAIAAERILPIDAATAVLDCRRAMEFAVKWMYSVDSSLVKPWDDKLISLMSTEEFHDIVDDDLWRRMDFIRKRGNDAAHGSRSISREQAELCLENLFLFLDFVAYCYGTSYQEKKFDASLLTQQPAAPVAQPALPDVDLDALIKENAELKAQLTAIAATKAGVPGKDIDGTARKVIADAGYGEYFGHGYGHSLGLEIHENPSPNASNVEPLPAGVVCSAEPGIYLPGKFGVRIEDVTIITEEGCEDITGSPKNLIIV